jgi:hypothetical protein
MRAFVGVLLLAAAGFVCGVTVATLNVAFEPKQCGEDCVNTAWASLLLWMPLSTIAFPTIGVLAWKRIGATWRHLGVIIIALSLITVLPAWAVYLYRAHVMHLNVPVE